MKICVVPRLVYSFSINVIISHYAAAATPPSLQKLNATNINNDNNDTNNDDDGDDNHNSIGGIYSVIEMRNEH